MAEHTKRFVIKGKIYETKPGTDWSLVYYDRDEDTHLSMAIFGQATITNALFETQYSFESVPELFGIAAAGIHYKALYQDNITEQVREFLRRNVVQSGHVVWYLLLGTGEIRTIHTESEDFVTAHTDVSYPELPQGGAVGDYIEILGIARADTDPELIV